MLKLYDYNVWLGYIIPMYEPQDGRVDRDGQKVFELVATNLGVMVSWRP